MIRIVTNILLIGLLLALSYEDIRNRAINIILLVPLCGLGIFCAIYDGLLFYEFINIILVLAVLLLVYYFSHCIGMGDVIVIVALLFAKGVVNGMLAVLMAFGILFVFWVALKMFGKVKTSTQVPFVPFLGIGLLGVMLCG